MSDPDNAPDCDFCKSGHVITSTQEIAALPPIQPSQTATNGQPERPVAKRVRAAEGPGARTTT